MLVFFFSHKKILLPLNDSTYPNWPQKVLGELNDIGLIR